ncbi:membrane-spanning 4-domains subfamily A member 7-like [Hippopotamus amphibius kiboko]|uniref:membrane-spanning 4-domains subfamily A member 7-like n=1 Tax=Hippopotamus amphibius kiboko TaxID=575201 RepID=UPI002591A562|nr:membrane-spanning 4-domains subfamily A member 7-like [Hippopotamus amphibius kiboko]
MSSVPKTEGASDAFTPKGIIIPEREKPGHFNQKDDLQHDLPEEATVLGALQILCCLLISSLGAILVSSSESSHFSPAISTIVKSGYPFLGALCFAITGTLFIIFGKKSTKPLAMSSLTASAVSSVAAGVGLLLLADSLVALGNASQQCDSEKDYLASLTYSIYEAKECLLTGVSLTGVLVVMLTFTVLELLLAVYASVFWWKQVYSNNPAFIYP